MQQLLEEQGFDFKNPSPVLAWSAFTCFIRIPIDGVRTTTFGIQISQQDDRDDILWLSFMRRLDEQGGIGTSCGCLLSRPTTSEFKGIQKSNWYWPEHGPIEQWITGVEQMPAFARLLAMNGWQWQGFRE